MSQICHLETELTRLPSQLYHFDTKFPVFSLTVSFLPKSAKKGFKFIKKRLILRFLRLAQFLLLNKRRRGRAEKLPKRRGSLNLNFRHIPSDKRGK
jgi:hypothetical protein